MEQSNVNNLNGIGNFGHGFNSENEEVIAGVTDEEATPAEEPEEEVETISNPEETE